MKIKFNWGIGIAVFYSAFVLFLLTNVLFSFYQNTDLVTDDYYNEELNYQEAIHKVERTERLVERLNISQDANILILQFPESLREESIKGIIHLYRPSDASADLKFQLNLNENNFQTINKGQMAKGLWILKINWSMGDSTYYNENKVIVN